MKKPKCLLVSDVQGWAFDQNNKDIIEYCSDEFDFDIYYLNSAELPIVYDFDFVYCPWHRSLGMLSTRTILGALRSEYFDTINKSPVSDNDIWFINQTAGFQICTKRVFDQVKDRTDKVVYLPNPVNTNRFSKPPIKKKQLIAQWNGNADHLAGGMTDIKGFKDIIAPACSMTGTLLRYAEFNTCRLPPDHMPAFYDQANVALCASEYEGCSNSVLEAMAAGLAVICTDVGNHRELHESMLEHFNASGMILVDRDKKSFVEAINNLTTDQAYELGQINRKEIFAHWSWNKWAGKWKDFFRMAL